MRRTIGLAVLMLSVAFTAGCNRGAGDAADSAVQASDTVLPQGDEAGEEITAADTGAGAYDPRSAEAIGFWRGAGNEPFWAVQVDTGGIVFKTPENQDGLRFPISVPTYVDDSARFTSVTPDTPGHEIEVIFDHRPCADSMSDRKWGYTARVTVDGTAYTGCADKFADRAAADRPWRESPGA
jgi:uncharacterized membrane protein